MYLPEETYSLSDTAKIGQEKNKIKFKYLNFVLYRIILVLFCAVKTFMPGWRR